MKMHSIKFKDPLISRAQPVTMIVPLVEEALRSAGIVPNRDFILDHFMNGQPRVAVVHGGDDHLPNLGMKETIRRVIRFIWLSDALPFEVAQSVPCEELAQGTETASYGLLSRNFCAAALASQMEVQGYDAATSWCLRQYAGRQCAGSGGSRLCAATAKEPSGICHGSAIPHCTRCFDAGGRSKSIRAPAQSAGGIRPEGIG